MELPVLIYKLLTDWSFAVIRMIAIILPLCAIMLSACNTEDNGSAQSHNPSVVAEKNTAETPKSNYRKPGAAIDFEHTYDGISAIGETDNIQLIFTEQYNNGQMRVMLNADQELNIKPAKQDFLFSMDSQQPHQIEISVEPQTEGKYYLNIFTSVLTDDMQQPKTRVFAIAFYVGDQGQKKTTDEKSSPENVIVLPSQETVTE